MDGSGDVRSLREQFRCLDTRNRANLVRAGLRIRTSADIFEALQREPEQARSEKGAEAESKSRRDRRLSELFGRYDECNRRNAAEAGLEIRTSADVFQAAQSDYERARAGRGSQSRRPNKPLEPRKRNCPESTGQPQSKRVRTQSRTERSDDEQVQALATVLSRLDEEFAEKEQLSHSQAWCAPVPDSRKVSTVQEFYKAFHDKSTLQIYMCMICYRKCARAELEDVDWDQWMASPIGKPDGSPFRCCACFPVGEKIPACADCLRQLGRGVLSPAAQVHSRLGCEHMFPDELKELTPVEEKLIALNSCYGFITKYSVSEGHRQGVTYPRHVKGHITVFPNNVQEVATRVLPHPLLKVMDDIHVSWQGPEKPVPRDLTALLSVRRRVVETALLWLKRHNPLYANIDISTGEMDSWDTPSHGVPSYVYDRLERNEPSAREKIQTAHIVPPTGRGLEDGGPVDIRELLASLQEGGGLPGGVGGGDAGKSDTCPDEEDQARDRVHDISSSGMFDLDCRPDIADAGKVRYLCEALGEAVSRDQISGGNRTGAAEVRRSGAAEPFILVSRGDDFAESLDAHFFAKTFPTLLPLGQGGPRQAEEGVMHPEGNRSAGHNTEAAVESVVASRNMSLERWAELVLGRHGGRFATHPVFAFLVFNMGVRSKNRRVSMASVRKKDFPEVERIVRSLTVPRLEKAEAELEASGKTADEGVNQLLRSLSLYGYRQPMSRESRLTMRRKIKSLIVRYGIPAIWFTLNPNDITNPVKLRLAAYRMRDADEAEAFLSSLDQVYKRARLAVSDPLSSAIFFHREISLFFKHYVRVGEDSVFGRVSQYFGAVETNERGALHLHGLLWLQGNMHLSSLLGDVQKDDQVAYRDRVTEYIDSIFTEVRVCCSPLGREMPSTGC